MTAAGAVRGQTPQTASEGSAAVGPSLAVKAAYECLPKPNYWGWKSPSHPDTGQLTDGRTVGTWSTPHGEIYTLASSMGWTGAEPVLLVDLGRDRGIGGIGLHSVLSPWGPWWPHSVTVLVSDDKREFYLAETVPIEAGKLDPPLMPAIVQAAVDRNPLKPPSTHWFRAKGLHAHGRYVALVLAQQPEVGTIVLDEIEIYADTAAARPTPRPVQAFTEGPAGMRSFRLHRAVNERLSRDAAALRQKLVDARIGDETKARMIRELSELQESGRRLPAPRSAGFRAVLPLNDLHARMFAVQARLWQAQGAPRLRVWSTNRWDPLSPLAEPHGPSPTLQSTMARNSFHSGALNLTNSDERPLRVHLSAADLPAGCCELFDVPFVDTHAFEPVAAPLLPLRNEQGTYAVDIPAGMTRQVWVRFCSRGLAPGKHNGSVQVRVDGAADAVKVPVTVEVYPVTLPPKFSLNLGGWDYPVAGSYEVTAENLSAYVAMLREYGVNVTWSNDAMPPGKYDGAGNLIEKPPRRAMETWLERWPDARLYGVFVGHLFPLEAPNRERMIAAWAADWAEFLQTRGVGPEKFVLLIQDEPTSAQELQAILRTGAAIKQSVPRFRIFNDLHFPDPAKAPPVLVEVMKRSCDIQCTAVGHLLQEPAANAAFRRVHGRPDLEWWCYTGGDSHRLTDPYVVWLTRAWFCFANDLRSAHFWSFGDGNGGFSWNEYLNNGVTRSPLYLDAGSVAPSKSMEAMREGAQDYELLQMARERLERKDVPNAQAERLRHVLTTGVARVLAPHNVTDMMWRVPKDRSVADEVRRELLHALSKGESDGF